MAARDFFDLLGRAHHYSIRLLPPPQPAKSRNPPERAAEKNASHDGF